MNISLANLIEAGQALKARREACGLTQNALAAAAGMTRVRLSQFERGQANISLATYLRLAQACGSALLLETATPRPTLAQLARERAQASP